MPMQRRSLPPLPLPLLLPLLLLGAPRAAAMQLYLQNMQGARTSVDFEPADLVDVVRAEAAALAGVDASAIGISRWEEVFEDGRTLADYDVHAGQALVYFAATPPRTPPRPPPAAAQPAAAAAVAAAETAARAAAATAAALAAGAGLSGRADRRAGGADLARPAGDQRDDHVGLREAVSALVESAGGGRRGRVWHGGEHKRLCGRGRARSGARVAPGGRAARRAAHATSGSVN